MKHPLARFLLRLIALPLLLGATTLTPFQITGVHGPLLLNIQHRLSELDQNKRLNQASPDTLREQVAKAMSPYGFFKPDITIQPLTSSKGPWRIAIRPGPALPIESLTVSISGDGQNNAAIQHARRTLPIHAGQPLNTVLYDEAKANLFSAAESEGYLHATFEKTDVLIDLTHDRATIVLLFNTGPRSYFGNIQFKPSGTLSPTFLQRYVPFTYGQPYSPEQVSALNTNLATSGYFRAVEVNHDDNSSNPHVPLVVNLEPINRTSYSLGAGYGTDTGPRGRAGLHVVPMNEHGHQFNAVAQGSISENALQMQYVIPGADPVHDHYNINGGFSNLNYTSGYSNAVLISFVQQHVRENDQRNLSLNALHERFNYTGQSRTEKNVLYPKGNLTWRDLSDELFSPSGYNVTLNGLIGHRALLSDINIAEASIDAKAAITLEPVRTRVYLHATQGITSINNIYDLPLSLALLLGGAENMKGSSFNSIGPGKLLTYAGLELQKETWEKWYLLTFVDAGDVYQPRPLAFQYDVGVGLMWRSPVGPIKIALAQPTNAHLQRLRGHGPRLVINMGPDL